MIQNVVWNFWLKNNGSRTYKFVGKGDLWNPRTSIPHDQQWFYNMCIVPLYIVTCKLTKSIWPWHHPPPLIYRMKISTILWKNCVNHTEPHTPPDNIQNENKHNSIENIVNHIRKYKVLVQQRHIFKVLHKF